MAEYVVIPWGKKLPRRRRVECRRICRHCGTATFPAGGIHRSHCDGCRTRRIPENSRRLCQRCQRVSIKRQRGRRYCGGCSRNVHTRRRWLKAGRREMY